MSFQVIISCTKRMASDTPAVCGMKSAALPEELQQTAEIEAILDLQEKAEVPCYYRYEIRQVEDASYHILCRSVLTGRGGEVRLVHALILSQDEVSALRQSTVRPTPAGVMLGLENVHFWRTGLPTETEEEWDAEPSMTASALPDASVQATWKRLTGHKSNAKILFTPPYDRACLVTHPQEVRQEDLLSLFHESDWLTSERGWGCTFATHGDCRECVGDVRRLAVPESVYRAGEDWGKIPVLLISPEWEPSPEPQLSSAPVTEQGGIPYIYTEAHDNDAYPYTRPPLRRFHRLLIAIGGLLFLAFCINLLVYGKVDDAGALAGKVIVQNEPTEPTDDSRSVPLELTGADDTPLPSPLRQEADLSTVAEPLPLPVHRDGLEAEAPAKVEAAPATKKSSLQWILPGQELPQEISESLSQGVANVSVYLLQTGGGVYRGTLFPGATPDTYTLRGERQETEIKIERKGAVLRSLTHRDMPIAVSLPTAGKRLLLLPRLRYRFGGMTTLPELSDIYFRIKASQIALGADGSLQCSVFPEVSEGKTIYTEHRVHIVLPHLRNREQSISCEQDESLPVTIKSESQTDKKGCCTIPVKLLLSNPFYRKVPARFQEITQRALLENRRDYTCATLFAMADKLAKGQLSREAQDEYTRLRKELESVLPSLPEMTDAEAAKQIKDAVCAYINDSLQALYAREKAQAESYDNRLELSLEDIREEQGGAIRWIFALQEETQDKDEP